MASELNKKIDTALTKINETNVNVAKLTQSVADNHTLYKTWNSQVGALLEKHDIDIHGKAGTATGIKTEVEFLKRDQKKRQWYSRLVGAGLIAIMFERVKYYLGL